MSAFSDVSPAWTYDVPIRSQELLSSWLCRSAHRHGFPAYRFLSWRLEGVPVLDRDFDLTGSDDVFAEIDRMARLPAGSAWDASLRSFVGLFASDGVHRLASAHVPFLLSAGVFHRTRRLHGLQACPVCLAGGDPHFSKWGRLAFVTVCPIHRCELIDGCGWCDAPIVPPRALVGGLGRCHSCLRPLSHGGVELPSISSAEAVAASDFQDLCLAASAAPAVRVSAMPCSGADLLRVARVLISICVSIPHPSAAAFGDRESRRQIERMRVRDRRRSLACVMGWLRDWPHRFREQADIGGLTARTFIRHLIPEMLAAEVVRLPPGGMRTRAGWRSLLDDPFMRSLRRTDVGRHRAKRAERLLAAARV